MIGRIQKTLLGRGGVQGLDDAAHRHRKQMFMSLMTPERIEGLLATTAAEWQARARLWAQKDEIVLYDELHELLTRAACAWAGVPLPEAQVRQRTQEITAPFDAAGSVGPSTGGRAGRASEPIAASRMSSGKSVRGKSARRWNRSLTSSQSTGISTVSC